MAMIYKHQLGNYYIDSKGYPQFTSGPYRKQRVHRVIAALMLGRKLKRDEDVHHKSGNKKNFRRNNLQVLGHAEHGYVSAMQHQFMLRKDALEKARWDEYFDDKKAS